MTNREVKLSVIAVLAIVFATALAFASVPATTATVYAATTWNVNHTFNGGMTYNEEIIVTQDVTLTINDCDVTANAGIYVQSGTLTIQGNGKLYVYGKRDTGYTFGHGIKGNVVVKGAKLTVSAADRGYGIQGNLDIIGADASVEVYGGYGGDPQSSGVGSSGGAGISGNVTVSGGSLYVEGGSGGDGAYGVGSKKGGSGAVGIGGNVTITGGGYVHAIGGSGGMGTGDYGSGGLGHYGIAGTLTATSGSAMVVGGEGGVGYNSYGPNAACYGAITAAVRKEGTTGFSWTDISEETSSLQYVKVEGHAHHFTYTADGATIIATCDADDCLLPDCQAAITLVAPTGVLMENGNVRAATVSGEIPYVAIPAVTYTRNGEPIDVSQVKTAGDYVASLTLGGATVSVEYTIIPPTYIITIPAKLDATSVGYHATDGISASGVILADQKVVVTANSSNGWKLKNGYGSISYYLTAAEGGAQKTKWVFYEDELAENTTKPMGAVIENFDNRIPSGEYTDTVTFTAKLESIYTTRDVWVSTDLYNAANGGAKTFTKDGYTLTCGNAYCSNGMFFITGGGSFTYATGVITSIELFGQTKGDIDPGIVGSLGWKLDGYGYGSSTNSAVWIRWTGEPAKTVRFNNWFRFEPSNYYIRITTIEDDR